MVTLAYSQNITTHKISLFLLRLLTLFYFFFFNLFQGRVWANATLKCQTQALKTLYQSAAQSCRAIYNAGFDAMHQCFIENKFCDINWDNRDAIWEIFDATDLNPGSTASRK